MTRTPLIPRIAAYLSRYVAFSDPSLASVAALWVIMTYVWQSLDSLPYLVITSDTKRSGKTRLSELIGFSCAKPQSLAGITGASLFRIIAEREPTLIIDEAEALSSESASLIRTVLNTGYRRGQSIPRVDHGIVRDYTVYCPKLFVLIGDVYDTLRDRSIVLRLVRSDAPTRFIYDVARGEGATLGAEIAEAIEAHKEEILSTFHDHAGLPYLPDRDEEIWTPLFCIAAALAPDLLPELPRIAMDLATEKTEDSRRYIDLRDAEEEASADEHAKRLVRDLAMVLGDAEAIFTSDALARLKALPTAPWRKYRGDGLDAISLSGLLTRFKGLAPRIVRIGGKVHGKRARGYRRAAVLAALNQATDQQSLKV